MKTQRSVLVGVVAFIGVLLWAGCSSDQVAGGTETGNPELGACVVTVFAALADSNQWNVRAYVPGGMAHLDSASMVAGPAYGHSGGTLAKQIVSRVDTIIGGMRYVTYTIFVDDTVTVRDTGYVPDTSFVRDTLVNTRAAIDSSDTVVAGDTTRIERQVQSTDSVFIVDTVVIVDTSIRVDTFFILDTIVVEDSLPLDTADTTHQWADNRLASYVPLNYRYAGGAATTTPVRSFSLTYEDDVADTLAVHIVMNSANSSSVLSVSPANFSVQNRQATVLITKSLATASQAAINETFGDLDGDGLLFGVTNQQIRYDHTYSGSPGALRATVDFSSGADGSFASVADNVVLALWRDANTALLRETVGYGSDNAAVPSDAYSLRVVDVFVDSMAESASRTYRLLRGQDVAIGNDDRLTGLTAAYLYRSGERRTVEFSVQLDSATARGVMPEQGALQVTIRLRDGSVGTLDDGRIDFADGIVRGTYRKNGESFVVSLDRNGEVTP